jgi:hypothetical protein
MSLASPAPRSLRDCQVAALSTLLSLNAPSTSANSPNEHITTVPTWKVLIMDKVAQDVVSTSLLVQDLRDQGVTLHMYVQPRMDVLCCGLSSRRWDATGAGRYTGGRPELDRVMGERMAAGGT